MNKLVGCHPVLPEDFKNSGSATKLLGFITLDVILPETVSHGVYLFIHHEGQFLVPGVNSFKMIHSREVKQLNIQIDGSEILPDESLACTSYNTEYDRCIENYWFQNLKNCTPPFMDSHGRNNQSEICLTYAEGQKAMQVLNSEQHKCVLPCTLFESKFLQNPIMFTLSRNSSFIPYYDKVLSANSLHRNNQTTFKVGYFIHLPKFITFQQSKNEYDVISYIAEMAGWAGLFLGCSLAGITTALMAYFKSKRNNISTVIKLQKGSIYIVRVLCLGYLAYLTVDRVKKLLENQLASTTTLENSKVDISLTLCTSQIMRMSQTVVVNNGNPITVYNSLLTHDFVSQWSNISELVSKILLFDGNGLSIDLEISDLNTSSINLPLTNGTIDFCHTIDLSAFQKTTKIKMKLRTEVKILLHNPSQLLYNWKTWSNVFTSVNEVNFNDDQRHYGINVLVKLEKSHLSLEEGEEISFDDCFMKSLLNNEKLSDEYKKLIKQPLEFEPDKIGLEDHYDAVRMTNYADQECEQPSHRLDAQFSISKESIEFNQKVNSSRKFLF